MLARIQRRTRRQLFLSTHSPDLLRDTGIGLDEALLFLPRTEGVQVLPAGSDLDIRRLLEAGFSLADTVISKTRPAHADQLALFGDA